MPPRTKTPAPARCATEAALTRAGLTALRALDGPLPVTRLARGDVLIQAGSRPEAVYALLRGRLRVHAGDVDASDQLMLELFPGAIVGEGALLAGGPRTATVVAAVVSDVVRIDAGRFATLLDRDGEMATVLAAETMERLRRVAFARGITAVTGELSPGDVARMQDRCRWVHVPAGAELFHAGDAGDEAYLVLAGRLRASVGVGDEERELGTVGPGALIGEAALLDGARRSATVTALRDSELAALDRTTLDDLLRDQPRAGLAIVRHAVDRALAGERPDRPAELSIAVVPVSRGVDVRMFASALAERLGGEGPVAHLWSARVDARLGMPGIAQRPLDDPAGLRLNAWLHEVESDARFLVHEVDDEPSGWTDRVMRWSDVVVLVGDAGEEPAEGALADAVRRSLREHPRRAALVLLHGSNVSRPHDTDAWLARHPADECHHVRKGSTADADRLARLVAGTAHGIALSGGGARGFAHLGVLRALDDAGFPVDVVGGTSMGAVVGSLSAMGLDADEMLAIAERGFRRVLDYTVPLVSMVSGQRIVRAMQQVYDDRRLEDLWRTYFCVSANLTRSRTVIHRRGPLLDAVRASIAIPGVIPPVPHGDDLLVDGGVLNNLPLDVLQGTGLVGTSIAVDVTPKDGPRAKSDFGLSVSGARALAGRVSGRPHPAPGITRVLLRSMLVGAMRDRDRHLAEGTADLFLDLDLRGIDMLDFSGIERVAAAGYEAAAPRVDAWLSGRPA